MSGYKGIDGNMLMAGSPDLDMIFADCDIHALLSGKGTIIVGLKPLKELAEKHDNIRLSYRCALAEQLIIAAQRLITWPENKETRLENAEAAIKILNVKS